ncbi:MAG TPA: hypothetical protein VLJ57_08655 [Burkholderiaceae bacterium]|nr:hypothetical protein [Burkholderiaceae bacterium]
MSEFNLKSVLRKTEQGVLAIKSRDPALPVKARTVLIVVGQDKTGEALLKLMPNPEETQKLLEVLIAQGYVEALPIAQTAVASSTTSIGPPAGTSPRDLKSSVQRASRLLYDTLGPSAEPLCMKLEACKTYDEFLLELQGISRVMASIKSEAKAQDFYAAATA